MKTINTYINEKLRLTSKCTYTCQPKSKKELQQIILQRIEDEGQQCDLNDIDVSKIKDMSYLFDNVKLTNFNGDISLWDVSNVKNTSYMFANCKKFDCDLSMWNVSNVKYMNAMFYKCKNFSCDLSKWDASKVENMQFAFDECPTQPDWYWFK